MRTTAQKRTLPYQRVRRVRMVMIARGGRSRSRGRCEGVCARNRRRFSRASAGYRHRRGWCRDRNHNPRLFEDHHAAAEAAGGAHEEFEEAIFAGGQLDGGAAAEGLAGGGVKTEIGDAQDGGAVVGAAPGEGADAGEQLLQLEGFGQIIVGAGVEALDAFVDFAAGGEEQDGSELAAVAQLAEDAEAIAAGEHDVEDQAVKGGGRKERGDVVAVVAEVHGKAFRLQRLADKRSSLSFVLDH